MVCKGHENTLPKSSLRIHIIKIKTVYVKLLLRQLFSVLYNNKLKIQKLMKTFFFIYVHSSLVFVFFASEFSIGISNKDAQLLGTGSFGSLQILYHGRFQHEPINDKVGLQPDVFDVYNHSYRRDHRLLPFEPIEIFVSIFSVFRIQK